MVNGGKLGLITKPLPPRGRLGGGDDQSPMVNSRLTMFNCSPPSHIALRPSHKAVAFDRAARILSKSSKENTPLYRTDFPIRLECLATTN